MHTHRHLRADDIMQKLPFEEGHDLLAVGQGRAVVSCSKQVHSSTRGLVQQGFLLLAANDICKLSACGSVLCSVVLCWHLLTTHDTRGARYLQLHMLLYAPQNIRLLPSPTQGPVGVLGALKLLDCLQQPGAEGPVLARCAGDDTPQLLHPQQQRGSLQLQLLQAVGLQTKQARHTTSDPDKQLRYTYMSSWSVPLSDANTTFKRNLMHWALHH